MNLGSRIKQVLDDWRREDEYWAEIEADVDPYYVTPGNSLRVYCLVRSDLLPPIQQGIQAAHAIVELERGLVGTPQRSTYNSWSSTDKTIIVLASEDPLRDACYVEKLYKLPFAYFIEPDLGNIVTATAVAPISRDLGSTIFSKMRLAR